MSISFQTSLLLVITAVIAAVAVSYYVYRHTVPVVSERKRWLLTSLRSLGFTFTLIALFEPLLTVTSSHEQLPAVAVLVDRSLSMSQKDGTGDRAETVSKMLQSPSFAQLVQQSGMQLLQFSHTVTPLDPDSLVMNGGATDISGALQSAQKNSPVPLQSIILITDGNYNAGSNPLYDAERSRLPVYTIGIGDSIEQKDIGISRLVANSIGYVESAIPVDATVRASGVDRNTVTVALLEEGKKIGEQQLTIPSSVNTVADVPVQFFYTPRSEGMKKLSVAVTHRSDEITEKNNVRSSMIKILKNKMNVTVVAGSPGPDLSAVMQTLRGDVNISATLFVQTPSGELKTQSNRSLQQSLSSADCLILNGFPTVQSSSATIQTIVDKIRERSLSVMFIAGRLIDPQKTKLLEPILPIVVVSPRIDEQTILPSPMPRHRFHALVQIDALRFPLFTWEKFPPVYASFQTFAAKPEAQTLLSIKIQGVTLQNPLLIMRNVAKTKSLAITGYGIYRWKVLASSSDETKGVFDAWFGSVVRWLATRDDDAQFSVKPSKEFFAQGEPAGFTGQLYNENFQPVDNAELELVIRTLSGEQTSTVSLQSIGSGRYEGTSPGLPQGEYTYRAYSLVNGDTTGTTSGRFSVGEQSIEFSETRMNKTLLQQIAEKSGGRYADASRADSLFASIVNSSGMRPQERITASEFELWNLPVFLSIIVALFATEWFLRKRWGML